MDTLYQNNVPMTYDEAVALIKESAFNIRNVPYDIIDERLLRYVRKRHAWALDSWAVDMPKDRKAWYKDISKNVWFDIIVRKYVDID